MSGPGSGRKLEVWDENGGVAGGSVLQHSPWCDGPHPYANEALLPV